MGLGRRNAEGRNCHLAQKLLPTWNCAYTRQYLPRSTFLLHRYPLFILWSSQLSCELLGIRMMVSLASVSGLVHRRCSASVSLADLLCPVFSFPTHTSAVTQWEVQAETYTSHKPEEMGENDFGNHLIFYVLSQKETIKMKKPRKLPNFLRHISVSLVHYFLLPIRK